MVAVRATAVAAARQPVTTTKVGLAVAWHRSRELIAANLPISSIDRSESIVAPGTPEFEALLDHKRFPRADAGRLTWLVDGEAFFSELEHQIASAQQSIDFQVYIFDRDDIAVRYADLLKRRSSDVQVNVLFDDLGSTLAYLSEPKTPAPRGFIPPSNMGTYLQADSKVRVRRILNPWLVCDHTKLLVFDHKTAILGGMNIGREYYAEWHDLMVRVEGPIVRSLSMEFDDAWRKAGPLGDFALVRKPTRVPPITPAAGEIPLRMLRTDPAEGRYEMIRATLLAINGARKRVWIQNSYLAHDDIVSAAEAAARRGVDVRIVIPSRSDSTVMQAGNLATASALIGAGAKVFMYPRMTHLKAMICDDWATVGSANFDTLSMRINRELNIAFADQATIRELEARVFLPDFKKSKRLSRRDLTGVVNPLAETVADQL